MIKQIEQKSSQILIAVVGPCAAGKSTLVDALKALGYRTREVAQEHSYVPDMWQRFTQPDVLIYLDVSPEIAYQRRPKDVKAKRWRQMEERLSHARAHADLYIQTDHLDPEDVIEKTLSFL